MGKPFVHKFTHNDKHYIYDVNTNSLMEVDDALYDIIDRITLVHEPDGLELAFDPQSPPAGTTPIREERAARAVTAAKEAHLSRGFFSDRRPTRMQFPFSRSELDLILTNLARYLILCVTEQCNLRCKYCAYSGAYFYARTHNTTVMSDRIAQKAVRFLVDNARYTLSSTDRDLAIGFYGGEPLLNFPLITNTVNYVRDNYGTLGNRLGFSITTNLTTRNEAHVRYLAENNFSLLVSLDGPQPLHDRYRVSSRGEATFLAVTKNLGFLRDAYPAFYERVKFSIVLSPPYDIDAVVSFFETNELVRNHELVVAFVDADNTCVFDTLGVIGLPAADPSAQISRIADRFTSYIKEGDLSAAKRIEPFTGRTLSYIARRPRGLMPDTMYPNGICIPGCQRTFVSADGSLYICEKIGQALRIGHVDSGYDISAVHRALTNYISIAESTCLGCWASRFCSLCFDHALKGETFDPVQQSQHCEAQKRSILLAMKQYCEIMPVNPEGLAKLWQSPEPPTTIELAQRFLREREKVGSTHDTDRQSILR